MSTVVMHNVVSVDGYIADENDEVGPLFDWYFNGDHPLVAGEMDEPAPGGMRVSKASYDYIRPTWDGIGSMVVGRHLFDMTNGWEGRPPAGEHVVVVSHRPKPDGWHPEASYHFVDDVAQAVAKAKELAGERTVAVAAGDVGGLTACGYSSAPRWTRVAVAEESCRRFRSRRHSLHLLRLNISLWIS
jgi:dihydrofolate reductase